MAMASDMSEPKPPVPGSLQSMLARLRGMVQALKATEQEGEELLPTWDSVAVPQDGSSSTAPDDVPGISETAIPIASSPARDLAAIEPSEAVATAQDPGPEQAAGLSVAQG